MTFSQGRPEQPRTAKAIRLLTTLTRKMRKSKEKTYFFCFFSEKNLKNLETGVIYMTCETVLPDHGQQIKEAVAWQHSRFEDW